MHYNWHVSFSPTWADKEQTRWKCKRKITCNSRMRDVTIVRRKLISSCQVMHWRMSLDVKKITYIYVLTIFKACGIIPSQRGWNIWDLWKDKAQNSIISTIFQILNVLIFFRKSVKLALRNELCGQTSKVEYQTICENAYIGHKKKIISYNDKIEYRRPNENKKPVLLMTPC